MAVTTPLLLCLCLAASSLARPYDPALGVPSNPSDTTATVVSSGQDDFDYGTPNQVESHPDHPIPSDYSSADYQPNPAGYVGSTEGAEGQTQYAPNPVPEAQATEGGAATPELGPDGKELTDEERFLGLGVGFGVGIGGGLMGGGYPGMGYGGGYPGYGGYGMPMGGGYNPMMMGGYNGMMPGYGGYGGMMPGMGMGYGGSGHQSSYQSQQVMGPFGGYSSVGGHQTSQYGMGPYMGKKRRR